MCDIDEGNRCVAWNATVRTARKEHRCCACAESIRPGDRYHFISGVWQDSGPESFKHCARCWAMYRAADRHSRENDGDGAMITLDCGEVWEEPPEHIAALAFALPGETPMEAP